MAKARAHVVVHGIVQGVGFRFACRREAAANGLTGWVRNNYDGSVEAVFEGERSDVEEMVDWCRNGPSPAHVRSVDVDWQQPSGRFHSFDITFS